MHINNTRLISNPFLILVVAVFSLLSMANASQKPIENDELSFEASQKSLSHVLGMVSNKTGMTISLVGQPPGKLNSLSVSGVTLERAIDRLMKTYGVENHAVIYDFEEKEIVLTILKSSNFSMTNESNSLQSRANPIEKHLPLTQNQIAQLQNHKSLTSESEELARFQSLQIAANHGNEHLPLTQNQVDQLQRNKVILKDEIDNKPLTAEQLSKLEMESELVVKKIQGENQSLSADQIEELRKKSLILQSTLEKNNAPLNEDQKRLLTEKTVN